MRKPHFLTQNAKQESPSICIYVDTETLPVTIKEGVTDQRLLFGWACYRRRKDGQWMAADWIRFEKRKTFWDWVDSRLKDRQKIYIYAHNLNFDAAVLGMLAELTSREFTLEDCMIDDPPTMFKWVRRDPDGKTMGTLQLVDTYNYFPFSLAKVGENMGMPKLKMPDFTKASKEDADIYCRRDVDVIRVAMESLQEFTQYHDMGNFALTQAGQSFNAFRHKHMGDHQIYIDSNPEALEVARGSYYGGRVEAFRIGKLDGEIFKLDVNSMYPYVMQKEKYPVRLIRHFDKPSMATFKEMIGQYTVCARVDIETDKPYLPMIRDQRLIFAVGKFTSQYATPELKLASDRGLIKRVYEMAVYEQATLFESYINYFYSMRQKATLEGKTEESYLLKIAMNSLYGKFGQNGRKWKTIQDMPDDDYEVKTWQEVDAQTGDVTDYRQIGGLIQKLDKEAESLNSFPAIAAQITSFARMYLLSLIEIAGWENVFYIDTDCLFVNAVGYGRLKHLVDPSKLGMLKLEGQSKTVVINGLKDYNFDGHAKLKGIRADAVKLAENTYEQDRWERWQGKVRNGRMDQMIISKVVKHVSGKYTKGEVLEDGKVIPFILA